MTSPTPRGTTVTRTPHAQTVLDDPLYVGVRPGCAKTLYWADRNAAHEATRLGYSPVRYEELETLSADQYTPERKDYGVYWEIDTSINKKDPVRMGAHVLMAADRARVEARKAAEVERGLKLRPSKTDRDPSTELGKLVTEEGTIGGELEGLKADE